MINTTNQLFSKAVFVAEGKNSDSFIMMGKECWGYAVPLLRGAEYVWRDDNSKEHIIALWSLISFGEPVKWKAPRPAKVERLRLQPDFLFLRRPEPLLNNRRLWIDDGHLCFVAAP